MSPLDLVDILKPLLHALVDQPENFTISATETKGGILLELECARQDVGKLIGRQGRNIDALRHLAGAAAARTKQRVILQVID